MVNTPDVLSRSLIAETSQEIGLPDVQILWRNPGATRMASVRHASRCARGVDRIAHPNRRSRRFGTGPEGNQRRVEFFLQFFGHENRLIFELAYLELARASYGTIKRLGGVVPRKQIEPMLRSRSYVQWRALAILMLAQTGETNDEQYIHRSFRLAERSGLTKDLAAWAMAAIELEGAEAVSFIERRYFRRPDRKQEELVEVVKALSLHGAEGRTDLRDQIVAAYAALLDIHPQMSEYVAKDLAAWKRTELRQRLAAIAATNVNGEPSGTDTGTGTND